MSEQTNPEPTMEEILASIRRIISEDDAPGAQAKAARQADDGWEKADIEAPAANGDASHAAAAPETHGDLDAYVAEEPAAPAADPEPVPTLEAEPTPEPVQAAAPAPPETVSPMPEPALAKQEPAAHEAGLVGEDAASKAASAFDRLSAAAAPPPAGASTAPALPAPGRTLEDLTRELLTPLIKSWLDQNLAAMVQARVDEEVERISRGRVR